MGHGTIFSRRTVPHTAEYLTFLDPSHLARGAGALPAKVPPFQNALRERQPLGELRD